jgi:hypothetical protein
MAITEGNMKVWRLTGWVCSCVIVATVLASVGMATVHSVGLVAVTVTALHPDKEPTDHNIPFVKRREALPDYELSLLGDDGHARYLGVKPDESAAGGLTWQLDDPVSISWIAAVRLREKDAVVSDALAEVQILGPSVEANGYRFDFKTERSIAVGVRAFFTTPIGIAIAAGFAVAVALIIVSNFAV